MIVHDYCPPSYTAAFIVHDDTYHLLNHFSNTMISGIYNASGIRRGCYEILYRTQTHDHLFKVCSRQGHGSTKEEESQNHEAVVQAFCRIHHSRIDASSMPIQLLVGIPMTQNG
jgi:hypothetical protein